MNSRLNIVSSCILLILVFSAYGSTAESHFQTGIQAYEQGDYETAKTEFERAVIIDEGPAARHNLGLAELKLDHPAQAIWQLERALLLDPLNRDYRNKLNLVREQLGLSTSPVKWYYQLSQIVSIRVWLMVTTVSFWLLIAVVILPLINKRPTTGRIRLLQLSFALISALSAAALWLNLAHLKTGIVCSEETFSLHAAPASAAPENGFARPGERARILNRHNGFYQIKTESTATGWISKDSFRPLAD